MDSSEYTTPVSGSGQHSRPLEIFSYDSPVVDIFSCDSSTVDSPIDSETGTSYLKQLNFRRWRSSS